MGQADNFSFRKQWDRGRGWHGEKTLPQERGLASEEQREGHSVAGVHSGEGVGMEAGTRRHRACGLEKTDADLSPGPLGWCWRAWQSQIRVPVQLRSVTVPGHSPWEFVLRSAAQIPDPLLQRMASHVGGIPSPVPFPARKGDSKNRVQQRQALGREPPHFLRHHGNSGRLDGAEPREDAEGKRCGMGQQRAPACHTQSPCHPLLPPTQHRDWHLVNVQIIVATRIMRMLIVIVNIYPGH